MRGVGLVAVAAVVLAGSAKAQGIQSPVCERLAAELDFDLKRASQSWVSPHQPADVQVYLQSLAANVELMKAAGCRLPTKPVGPLVYNRQAIACADAGWKGPACDLGNWKRED